MTFMPNENFPTTDDYLDMWQEENGIAVSNEEGNGGIDISSNTTDLIGLVINSVEGILNTSQIKEDMQVVAPTGSNGEGIYSDKNVVNPDYVNPVQREQEKMSSLTGYTKEIVENLLSWQRELAKNSPEEFRILSDTLPSQARVGFEPLQKELKNGLKTTASAVMSIRNDYEDGNSLIKNNNIRQVEANQYRLATDSITNIKSPLFSLSTKQSVHEAEQYFITTDISHITTKHFWLRAEWGETYLSLRRTSYILGDNVTKAGNETSQTGLRSYYSDQYVHEVGQKSFMSLHPLRSRAGSYGSVKIKSVSGQNYQSTLGSIGHSALFNASFGSVAGVTLINSFGLKELVTSALQEVLDFLQAPEPMRDPPEYEKRDFSAPGGSAVSRNNNTPEVLNVEKGASSGAYGTSYGTKGVESKVVEGEGSLRDRLDDIKSDGE
jgi:hypothetical protein